MENKTLNQKTLLVFAPLLILTGIAGFVIPERYSLMSGAAPYNLFHIIFGCIGLLITMTNSDALASSFNLGFGLIDLYQVLASVVVWRRYSISIGRTGMMCFMSSSGSRS